MRVVPSWNKYFMDFADSVARRSKDPNSQVGCVLVDPDAHIQATGYNGMIAHSHETPEMWERPTKYDFVCHAEMNAVAQAAKKGKSLDGCSAYITHSPCSYCFRLLVQAGITTIFFNINNKTTKFQEDMVVIKQILTSMTYPAEVMGLDENAQKKLIVSRGGVVYADH